MENVKQESYKNHLGRFKRAMKTKSFLEGVVLFYDVFEDTTFRFFKDIGWISQNGKTISDAYKKPFKRHIKPEAKAVSIKGLANKLKMISDIIEWAYEKEETDDRKLKPLHKAIRDKLDKEEVFGVLRDISLWRQKRNRIIHDSLNSPFDIVIADAKDLCENGLELFRYLDTKVIKKLKRSVNSPKHK